MKERRYAQRIAWAGNARHLGVIWRSTAKLLAGEAVVVASLALWPHMFIRQGLIGLAVGFVLGVLVLALARLDDPQVRGDLAEQWSAEAFGKVRGWQVTNGLSFLDGDLDHVVVTPSGVLAVETKYRFRQPDRRRLAEQRQRDLDATMRAARKTASVLRSKDVRIPVTVTPVLMVWGKGAPDLPDGYTQVGDTYVLDGDHPGLWSHLFNAPLLPPDVRSRIHIALTGFQRRQLEWAERDQMPLRQACWQQFWVGVQAERAEHQQKRRQRQALRRRHRHDAHRHPGAPQTSGRSQVDSVPTR